MGCGGRGGGLTGGGDGAFCKTMPSGGDELLRSPAASINLRFDSRVGGNILSTQQYPTHRSKTNEPITAPMMINVLSQSLAVW